MNRRTFLAASTGLALGIGADALGVEPADVELSEHEVNARADARQRRVLFAQISDLHIHRVGAMHRRIAAEVNARRPHFVLLTGDLIDRVQDLPVAEEFLRLLDADTRKYAVLGNWEHWCGVDAGVLGATYARHSCRLLVNETFVHWVDGRSVAVTGLDDLEGKPDLVAALRGVSPADRHLVIAHSPAWHDRMDADAREIVVDGAVVKPGVDLAPYHVDVVLSGHSHGGQVSVAGWAPMLPRGVGRYVRGWFRDVHPPLFVSRGVGTSVVPVRLGSRPEVAFHTLWV